MSNKRERELDSTNSSDSSAEYEEHSPNRGETGLSPSARECGTESDVDSDVPIRTPPSLYGYGEYTRGCVNLWAALCKSRAGDNVTYDGLLDRLEYMTTIAAQLPDKILEDVCAVSKEYFLRHSDRNFKLTSSDKIRWINTIEALANRKKAVWGSDVSTSFPVSPSRPVDTDVDDLFNDAAKRSAKGEKLSPQISSRKMDDDAKMFYWQGKTPAAQDEASAAPDVKPKTDPMCAGGGCMRHATKNPLESAKAHEDKHDVAGSPSDDGSDSSSSSSSDDSTSEFPTVDPRPLDLLHRYIGKKIALINYSGIKDPAWTTFDAPGTDADCTCLDKCVHSAGPFVAVFAWHPYSFTDYAFGLWTERFGQPVTSIHYPISAYSASPSRRLSVVGLPSGHLWWYNPAGSLKLMVENMQGDMVTQTRIYNFPPWLTRNRKIVQIFTRDGSVAAVASRPEVNDLPALADAMDVAAHCTLSFPNVIYGKSVRSITNCAIIRFSDSLGIVPPLGGQAIHVPIKAFAEFSKSVSLTRRTPNCAERLANMISHKGTTLGIPEHQIHVAASLLPHMIMKCGADLETSMLAPILSTLRRSYEKNLESIDLNSSPFVDTKYLVAGGIGAVLLALWLLRHKLPDFKRILIGRKCDVSSSTSVTLGTLSVTSPIYDWAFTDEPLSYARAFFLHFIPGSTEYLKLKVVSGMRPTLDVRTLAIVNHIHSTLAIPIYEEYILTRWPLLRRLAQVFECSSYIISQRAEPGYAVAGAIVHGLKHELWHQCSKRRLWLGMFLHGFNNWYAATYGALYEQDRIDLAVPVETYFDAKKVIERYNSLPVAYTPKDIRALIARAVAERAAGGNLFQSVKSFLYSAFSSVGTRFRDVLRVLQLGVATDSFSPSRLFNPFFWWRALRAHKGYLLQPSAPIEGRDYVLAYGSSLSPSLATEFVESGIPFIVGPYVSGTPLIPWHSWWSGYCPFLETNNFVGIQSGLTLVYNSDLVIDWFVREQVEERKQYTINPGRLVPAIENDAKTQRFDLPDVTRCSFGITTQYDRIIADHYYSYSLSVDDSSMAVDPNAKTFLRSWARAGRCRAVMQPMGPVLLTHKPIVFAKTLSNEIIAVNKRALIVVDQKPGSVDRYHTLIQCLRPLLARAINPTKISRWLSKFPASVRAKLREAQSRVCRGFYRKSTICHHKVFVKHEKIMGLNSHGRPDKTPRLIIPCEPEFNIVTGPFYHALSKYLRRTLTCMDALFYAAGASAEECGFFEEHNNSLGLTDNNCMDESKFDAHFTFEGRRAELDKQRDWYGMPPLTYQFMTWLISDFRGTTPNGYSFKTKGRRLSGEAATTVGNTEEELLMSFADYSACLIDSGRTDILSSHILHVLSRGRVGKRFFAIAAAGDDNHSKSSPYIRQYINGHPIKTALGFECKSVWTTKPEFLSSMYAPVAPYSFTLTLPPFSPGPSMEPWVEHPDPQLSEIIELKCSTLLVPLIGRQLAKCGWDIEMDPFPLAKMSSVMRGVEKYWSFIPVLRSVVSKYRDLSNRRTHYDPYKINVSQFHNAVPATWHAYCDRYSVTPQQLLELESIIANSPAVFDLSRTVAFRLASYDLYGF